MKKLMFGMACLVLLVTQANAQQATGGNIAAPKTETTVTAPSKPHGYRYTLSSGSNSSAPTVATNSSGNVSVNGSNYSYSQNSDVQDQDDPMKTKTFSKSFSIDKNDKINLNNQFGSITIKTWPKNEIKVDADIKAYAKTDEDAQKLLDDVTITATKDGDVVTFKTILEKRDGNWGRSIKNGKTIWRREAKIHYVVYMPATNSLSASQQYGNIDMEDFAGPTSLKVQYGNLSAGNLTHSNNNINVQYGKTTIDKVNDATVKHQYGGGINIGSANELDVDAQYVGVTLGNIKNKLNVKAQYGSGVKVISAGSLNLNAQYTAVSLEKLSGNFTGKLQYGNGLSVDEIESGCKVFNCDAEYARVSLGFANGYNANANISTHYGSFKYPNDMAVKKLGDNDDRNWSSEKKYTVQIGKGGSNSVQINTTYQGVTFK
jgi:hypothetical protein